MPPDVGTGSASDDASLVRASLDGDREAFAMLVSRHARSVLSLTTRMLGATDAEDVAQETFVSAYKALPRFQFSAKFSTWLYRIGVNKCHDVLRARRPGMISLDSTDGEDVVASIATDDETPYHQLEQLELGWQLDKGIQALPPLYRESFVLKHVEGLGYEEMSEILGTSRDTLKMRVYKARTLLCRSLAHLEGARR
jgi:RNA polymerase sigma-70 factor (ECF subfamily)